MKPETGKGRPAAGIRKIPAEAAAAFAGALITGLAAHGMALLNKLSWHDDIFALFRTGATVTSGRWMLQVLSWLEILIFGDGHFSLPLVNGGCALLCIGLSAGMIAVMLKIRSRSLSFLLGGLTAVFPVVTALMGFMFTVHYYMLGLAMGVAAAWLICAGKKWPVKAAGALLLGCSVGVYQAFLPVTLALILLSDFREAAEGEERLSAFWRKVPVQALLVAAGMVVYSAAGRFFLRIEDMVLDSYMGINAVGDVPLTEYLRRAGDAYRMFFLPARNTETDMFPQHLYYLYLLTVALNAAMGAALLFRAGKRSPGRAATGALMLALLPLGCNFIFVMSAEVHSLMVYGWAMHFALFVLLADRLGGPRPESGAADAPAGRAPAFPALSPVIRRGAALLLALACAMYIRFDNQCYLKTVFQQQQAISWYTGLVARIKSAPGYRDELPVAYVNREKMRDPTLYNIDELDFVRLGSYEQDLTGYLNNWAWESFLARWCGFGPDTLSEEETEALKDLPAVRRMPAWPDEGSVQVIGDTVVVKFE